MAELVITRHALARYAERVAAVPEAAIIAALTGPAFRAAARIGAPFVRLPGGQRAVLSGHTIITILGPDHAPGALDRRRPEHPSNRKAPR